MSLPPPKMLICICDEEVRLRIAGHANFTAGPDFQRLVTELYQKGYRRFRIDMSECVLMDSTFLGLICGLGLKLRNATEPNAGVELLNPNPRVTDLLESLGICAVVSIRHAPSERWELETVRREASTPPSREDMARTSLEAHQTLMSLSPENQARFKDVARFLAEDLKQLKRAS